MKVDLNKYDRYLAEGKEIRYYSDDDYLDHDRLANFV